MVLSVFPAQEVFLLFIKMKWNTIISWFLNGWNKSYCRIIIGKMFDIETYCLCFCLIVNVCRDEDQFQIVHNFQGWNFPCTLQLWKVATFNTDRKIINLIPNKSFKYYRQNSSIIWRRIRIQLKVIFLGNPVCTKGTELTSNSCFQFLKSLQPDSLHLWYFIA